MCSRIEATEKVRPLQGLCCRASPSKLDSAREDQLWDPEPFPLYTTYNVSVLVHDPTEIVWKGESREFWKWSENPLVDHILPDQCDWFARSHDQLNSRFNGHHLKKNTDVLKFEKAHLHMVVCSSRWGWQSQSPQCPCDEAWCRRTRGPLHWAWAAEVAWESRSPARESCPELPPLSLLKKRYTRWHVQLQPCSCFRVRASAFQWDFSPGGPVCLLVWNTHIKVMNWYLSTEY